MIPKILASGTPRSEVRVHKALRGLSDDWIVLHGVNFIVAKGKGREPFTGEADFVLLHPRYGYIVLEVKGGTYDVREGTWFAGPERARMNRSPFEQAKSNRFNLQRHIKERTGIEGIRSGHAVAFPDGRPKGHLGLEAPVSIVVDGLDLVNIKKTVGRVCEYWFPSQGPSLSENELDRLLSILAPSSGVVADRRYQVEATSAEIDELTQKQIQLTDEQIAVIEATSTDGYVSILGAAGTGKTLIAEAQAKRLAGEGKTVLLLAYDGYLTRNLRQKQGLRHINIRLGSVSQVLGELEATCGVEPNAETAVWERCLKLAEEGVAFDAVIVDEAQSYDDDVLEALRSMAPGSYQLYGDPYQRDPSGMWRPPGKPQGFWLTQNCRNSLPIAKLVSKLSGALPPQLGASGRKPQLIIAERDGSSAVDDICACVKRLITEMPPERITVLSYSSDQKKLMTQLKASGLPIAGKGTAIGISVATVDAFRGSESPVVLLWADSRPETEKKDIRTLNYVATSRAIADLIIFGRAEDWTNYMYLMGKP
jgi:hypothetical protein